MYAVFYKMFILRFFKVISFKHFFSIIICTGTEVFECFDVFLKSQHFTVTLLLPYANVLFFHQKKI